MTNSIITPEDLSHFGDHQLEGRNRIALAWLDDQIEHLLDAGSSYGYATRFYSAKAKRITAIDFDEHLVAIGKAKYPQIEFLRTAIDHTPFADETFDAIVMTDVLEHVLDTTNTLNELYRLLKPGGAIIITTPHKGLFSFLDPFNYGYYLKKYARPLYNEIYKVVGRHPEEENLFHSQKHNHYSLADLHRMLDASQFAHHYRVEHQLRSGLLAEVALLNLEVLTSRFIKNRRTVRRLLQPLAWLADKDYNVSYSIFSLNIGLKLRKVV